MGIYHYIFNSFTKIFHLEPKIQKLLTKVTHFIFPLNHSVLERFFKKLKFTVLGSKRQNSDAKIFTNLFQIHFKLCHCVREKSVIKVIKFATKFGWAAGLK